MKTGEVDRLLYERGGMWKLFIYTSYDYIQAGKWRNSFVCITRYIRHVKKGEKKSEIQSLEIYLRGILIEVLIVKRM